MGNPDVELAGQKYGRPRLMAYIWSGPAQGTESFIYGIVLYL